MNETKDAPNGEAIKTALLEIKLHINQRLYNKGVITEEMYTKAKEDFINGL